MIALVALWVLWLVHPAQAMVYINPSCAVHGDGAAGEPCANAPGGAGPRNTWVGMPWVSGETYAQRANSVYIGMVDVTTSGASKADRITLTTYGDGARAIIRGTGQQFGVYLRGAVAHVTLASMEVYGVDSGVGNRFLVRLGNGAGEEATDIHLIDLVLHSPVDPGGASEANAIWGYCADCTFDRLSIYDIPSDGLWLANVGHFTLRDSRCERVATSGRNTGDCVQLGGTATGLTVQRNILDHSSTEAKNAFIDLTMGGSGGVVEDNDFLMSTAGDQSTTSKALSLAVNNLTIRRNRVIGGDWNFAYSGSGDISGNEFRGARSRGWQIVGTGQSVHAYRNRFIGGGVGIGVNASGPDGTVRLTDNTLSGYTVGVQRSDAVQVQSQGNRFWSNGQHAVGVMLDGSTRYAP